MGAARKLFFIVTIVFLIIKKRTCSVSLCYKGRQLKPAKMQKKIIQRTEASLKNLKCPLLCMEVGHNFLHLLF